MARRSPVEKDDRAGTGLGGTLKKVAGTIRRRLRRRPVRWGSLRKTTPVSSVFGLDRGTPVDRYYIEKFLLAHAAVIQGRVLEIGDSEYTRKFGGQRVSQSDVLHAVEGNPAATLVGDLESGAGIPDNTFDCIILTQTLHVIYDVRAALQTTQRALRSGGTVLATVPGISQISRYDMDRWGDYWRFTSRSAIRLWSEIFGVDHCSVESYGNVLAATAFLQGVSAGELTVDELDDLDPDYQVLIGIAARRGDGTAP